MGKDYDFRWIQEKARRLEFGELLIKALVASGKIVKVQVVSELESRTLEESNRKPEDGLV